MDRNIVVNLGEQRFDRLIEENKFYIDKKIGRASCRERV